MVDLKSRTEIEKMSKGGHLLSEIARDIKSIISPGISTIELDEYARKQFKKKRLKPAFLNYGTPPFPATICTSINEEIVHGIPSTERILKNGDIISVDLGGIWSGFYVDMAFTVGVGQIKKRALRLMMITEKAFKRAVSQMYVGNKLHDISWAIQTTADEAGYSVVRDLVSHGIGRHLHEDPHLPNFGRKNTGIKLREGLVLAIEPMINTGGWKIKTKNDGWTITTFDGSLSCHFENTVALSKNGPELLTYMD